MKSETKDKLFLAVTLILMLAAIAVIFVTVKEMPEPTTYAPMFPMGYPLGPF